MHYLQHMAYDIKTSTLHDVLHKKSDGRKLQYYLFPLATHLIQEHRHPDDSRDLKSFTYFYHESLLKYSFV